MRITQPTTRVPITGFHEVVKPDRELLSTVSDSKNPTISLLAYKGCQLHDSIRVVVCPPPPPGLRGLSSGGESPPP
ncbi:hypothetical protein [Endozoicomonas euniceicola]|uniref:Uncharacterized protein n=1 Tax=Endozoicomonas euniceicola TaxID=1234143 RepID=A0ABY6GR87_9GAMM|nr:hypothetical protein [Endozoicomonas euniceicola]UYM15265.1 hypothetical protein NX720_20780 [Endozoicomonas euniceicola]